MDWLKLNDGMGVVSSRSITDKQAERITDAGLALAGDNIDSPKNSKSFMITAPGVFTYSIYRDDLKNKKQPSEAAFL